MPSGDYGQRRTKMTARQTVVFGLVCSPAFLLSLVNCTRPPQQNWPTVKGPEDASVKKHLGGAIVYEDAGEAYLLGVGESKPTLLFAGTKEVRTHTVSGPDAKGRVALVDNNMTAKRHGLRVLSNGKTSTLFERSGDALWGDFKTHPISAQIAMSRRGQIAILTGLAGTQLYDPQMYLQQGPIEIWSSDTKKMHAIKVNCLDQGISWFPDERRIAVVRTTSADDLRKRGLWPAGFGSSFKAKEVPAVHIVDTASGTSKAVIVGWGPIVSQDGKSIYVEDYDRNSVILDLRTGTSKSVKIPGHWGPALALTADGRLIYWGVQTEGAKQKATVSNGLPGPRPMLSIKVVDLKTGKFATLLPYVDPRMQASYGYAP